MTIIRAMSTDMATLIRDKTAVDSGTMDGPNIMVIDGNPLVDITNISNVKTVVKSGKVYRTADLEDVLRNDR